MKKALATAIFIFKLTPLTQKQTNIILYSSIAATGITILAIWKRNWIMENLSLFKIRAKAVVKKEYNAWNSKDGSKITENDPAIITRLQKYWQEGAGRTLSDAGARAEAWSAAFISYVMKKSGVKNFPFSASHSTYITAAIKNRKEGKKGIKGYKVDEKKVQVGDLVCYARQSGANYDSAGPYLSHCDIITKINKNEADSVGGNVSQSVSKTIVPLTHDGFIDKSKDKKGYFVIIKK